MTGTVRERFVFTVGANLLRSLISFVTGMLLARWLGPDEYGNMAFLLGTFLALRQLLDMGSSMAFFTFLAQRPRSRRFVWSFFGWLSMQFLVPLLAIGLLFPSEWVDIIWKGEQRGLVLLALAAAFMQNSLWPVVQNSNESQRQTLWVQSVGVMIWVAHLIAIILLWLLGVLGLYAILAAIALEYLLGSIVAIKRLSYADSNENGVSHGNLDSMLKMYAGYCLPLIPYAWIGFAYEFADRWLLQSYGGSVEQAYYAVGAKFAAVSLIATSSILRIFWKEVAEANQRQDHERTAMMFKKVSRSLFLIGAIIAGFLIPWTEDLLTLILGAAYVGGATTVAIMFLYPVHQSLGQICNTVFYATEKIWLYVVTNGIFSIASIAVTYALLAVLGLASEGLALKMVAIQIISVNVMAFIIARLWKRPFDWLYQPVSLAGCVGFGWLAYVTVTVLVGNFLPLLVTMGMAGLLYLMLTTGFVYAMPWLADMSREELVADTGKALRKFSSGLKFK